MRFKPSLTFVFVLLLICSTALLSISGCGSGTTSAVGGALAGGAAANTFAGMQADLEAVRQAKLGELQAAVDKLDEATTETEKAALQAKVRALEKTIQTLQDAQTAVGLGRQGTEVNWTDPAAIGGFGGTALAAFLAWYFRKKGLTTENKYQAHKQGAERFMLEQKASDQATRLYDLIGQARQKNGV